MDGRQLQIHYWSRGGSGGKMLAWGAFVIGVCAAQSNSPDATEMNKMQASLVASLSGQREIVVEAPTGPPGERTQANSVSVAQLRHKPVRSAQKHVSRGMAFSRRGDPARAAAEFEKAILDDPEHVEAHVRLGIEYTALQRYAEAEAVFRRAIALDPGAATAYYDLGILLYGMGNLEGAEQCARRALAMSNRDAQAHFLLGQLLWRRPETRAESVRHLQYAARTIPQAKQVLQALGER